MALKQVIEICDLLDRPAIDAAELIKFFLDRGLDAREFESHRVRGAKGETQFVKIRLRGRGARSAAKRVPTLGIIGRLGGVGARPHRLGLVSDADGAIAALACALKLTDMRSRGDALQGRVVIATHLSPRSPVIPHDPVPFMGAPVSMTVMNRFEVDPDMDAVLSIDTT